MLAELLHTVTTKLDNNGIDYMISGSLALNIYSTPRMTRDIDIVIHLKEEYTNVFINSFKERFYLNKQTIYNEVKKKGMFNIIDNQSGYKIDFIIRKDTPYRIQEFKRKKLEKTLGTNIWVVTVEDLIISKLFWIQDYKSELQINDIKNLLEYPNIDFDYLQKNIQELKLKTYNLFK